MKVFENVSDKVKYRNIENQIFDFKKRNIVKNNFSTFYQIEDFSLIRQKSFYLEVLGILSKQNSLFCISTIVDKENIYLIDYQKDKLIDFFGVMNSPNLINPELSNEEVGIGTTNEIILMYSPEREWAVYADRFYDYINIGSNIVLNKTQIMGVDVVVKDNSQKGSGQK